MDENAEEQCCENTDYVHLDKRAEILEKTFKHYYTMAMDHHTKAATTSNILLALVGAIITLSGFQNGLFTAGGVIGGLGVSLIGAFGMVWAWKQHERYYYWYRVADKYQKELAKIVPELKAGSLYEKIAKRETRRVFGKLFAEKIEDRYLWVILHGFILVVGLGLMVYSSAFA